MKRLPYPLNLGLIRHKTQANKYFLLPIINTRIPPSNFDVYYLKQKNMKMLTLCLIVILITTFTSLLFSESLPQLQLQGMDISISDPATLSAHENIFYQDPDNNILLIDFKEVSSKLSKIIVSQANQILLEDSVGDLAIDSIYEVDLTTYGKGTFMITLVTTAAEEIEEQIIIK